MQLSKAEGERSQDPPRFLCIGGSKAHIYSFDTSSVYVCLKWSLSQSLFSALVSRLFWCSSVADSLDVSLQVQEVNQIYSGNYR